MMKTFIYKGIGISDEAFLRGKAPMTKEEVRTVTMSKLKPQSTDTVVDIGAGTGSVSVECAYLAKRVIAVECERASAELIKQNADKFELDNIEVINGTAPEALEGINNADCVFIGGSKGNLKNIIDWANGVLSDDGRIAANFITLENAVDFLRMLKKSGFENIDLTQVQISKGKSIGDVTMMQAHNPVFIICGERSR